MVKYPKITLTLTVILFFWIDGNSQEWRRLDLPIGLTHAKINLIEEGFAFAQVDNLKFLSEDFGDSWRILPSPNVSLEGIKQLANGYLVGSRPLSGIYLSRDKGESWEHIFDTGGGFSSHAAVLDDTIFVGPQI